MTGIRQRVWPWKRQLETGLISSIWTYRWQRHSTATNIDPTDCNLPTQGWSNQSNWTAHGNLSRWYFCPGKARLSWSPAGAKQAPPDDSSTNLLTRQYSFDCGKIHSSSFPGHQFPQVGHLAGASVPEDFLAGQPCTAFPSSWSHEIIWCLCNSLPLSPTTMLISTGAPSRNSVFQSAHPGQ